MPSWMPSLTTPSSRVGDTRSIGSRAASFAQASPPSPNPVSGGRSKPPRRPPSSSSSKPAAFVPSRKIPVWSPRLISVDRIGVLSLSASRQSSGGFKKGMLRSELGSPRAKDFIEGQISWESRIERSGKNLEARASISISVLPLEAGCISESSFAGMESLPPSSPCCALGFSSKGVASLASSLLSKTIRTSESIERWLRRSPLAPPSSKSADAFLKSGSTANSSSIFFNCRDAKEGASVASWDLCVY